MVQDGLGEHSQKYRNRALEPQYVGPGIAFLATPKFVTVSLPLNYLESTLAKVSQNKGL
jgi:hypothetical protein